MTAIRSATSAITASWWAMKRIGDAELVAQVEEQVQQLGLDRDVERADGLVGDDHLRVDGEGAGDRDALALAAGELARACARRCGR